MGRKRGKGRGEEIKGVGRDEKGHLKVRFKRKQIKRNDNGN